MTAPLAGRADAPDIPASPMPVAAKLTNKIVRICCLLHLMLVINHSRLLDHKRHSPPMCVLLMPPYWPEAIY